MKTLEQLQEERDEAVRIAMNFYEIMPWSVRGKISLHDWHNFEALVDNAPLFKLQLTPQK